MGRAGSDDVPLVAESLGGQARMPRVQHLRTAGRERDAPAGARGLGFLHHDALAALPLRNLHHLQPGALAVVEMDVCPVQAQQLAQAHARMQRHRIDGFLS